MSAVLEARFVTAKKSHKCSCCRREIEPGERYFLDKCVYDGEFYTTKFHRFCRDFMSTEFFDKQDDYFFEWDPQNDFTACLENWWDRHMLDTSLLFQHLREARHG